MTLQDRIFQCNLSVRGSDINCLDSQCPASHLALGFYLAAWSKEYAVQFGLFVFSLTCTHHACVFGYSLHRSSFVSCLCIHVAFVGFHV